MDREHKRRRRKKQNDGERKPSGKKRKAGSDKSSSSSYDSPQQKSEILLTPNAVESLLSRASILSKNDDVKKAEELIVRLRVKKTANTDNTERAVVATLSDGKYWIEVLVLNPSRSFIPQSVDTGNDCVVAVHAYITTEGHNPKYQLKPIVCLTSFTVLATPRKEGGHDLGAPCPIPSQKYTRITAGAVGSFLLEILPFLTNEELAGSVDMSASLLAEEDDTVSLLNHQDNVQKCLARHAAMMTLRLSSPSSADAPPAPAPPETPTKQPTEHAVQNYTSALREFSASQLDRQIASLGTNAGREAADRASLISERHNAALEQAMKENSPLTTSLLCSWHAILLQDLHPEAGEIRSKTVRAGNTVFAPPKKIRSELLKLELVLESLEQRLDMGNAVHAILFACVCMYGITHVHPFIDGNGRLSRIAANWALKQLPFPINLFATPAQRAEYVLALEKTRHRLSLTRTYGNVSRDEILQAIKYIGVFAPLVRLLMDRVGRAVLECNRVLEEKSGLAAEAAEARAARRARERAQTDTCIICLDEKPNIATLCCGKAVHLNCIAEWLSGRNSCPVCRSRLPTISGRVVRAAGRERMANEDSNEGHIHERMNVENARDVIVSLLSSFDTTTTADDSYDSNYESAISGDDERDESEDEESEDQQIVSNTNSEDITTAMDDTTMTTDSEDNSQSGRNNIQDAAPDPSTTANSEEQNENDQAHYCDALYCRNRPAVDCTNDLCGRCCVLGGQFHCPRHNS
jgi:fido (protein-threonine AMPylation protein)